MTKLTRTSPAMQDECTPERYGAVGDGVADDTVALNSWAQATGFDTKTASGSYLVAGSIVSADNDTTYELGYAVFTQTVANRKTFDFTDADRIRINGGVFIGVGTEHSGASTSYNGVAAIYLQDPRDCEIEYPHITNHAGGGIRFQDAEGLTVRNAIIRGIGTVGGIAATDNNSDFAIGSFGSAADNNVRIEGCDISEHCFGVGAARGTGLRISDCHIHDIPGQHGIYASAMGDMIVTGNRFYNIEDEAVKNQIATSSTPVIGGVFTGNAFRVIGGTAIVLGSVAGVSNSPYSGVVIDNNTVYSCGNYFLALESVKGVIGDSNVFNVAGAYGLYLNGFEGRVGKSEVRNTQWSGYWIEMDGDVEIEPNLVDCCLNTIGESAAARTTTYAYATINAGASGTPVLTIDGGSIRNEATLAANVANCFRTSGTIDVRSLKLRNFIGKPWWYGLLSMFEMGVSADADFQSGGNLNAVVPIVGRRSRVLTGTQSPADAGMTSTFRDGDFCYASNFTVVSDRIIFGWACVTTGTPGTWVPVYLNTV